MNLFTVNNLMVSTVRRIAKHAFGKYTECT